MHARAVACLQVLPSVALLSLVEAAARQVQAVLAPHSARGPASVRPRVPRYVDPGTPLQRYNWLESYCRLLLYDAVGGLFRHETFVGGVPVRAWAGGGPHGVHVPLGCPEVQNEGHW